MFHVSSNLVPPSSLSCVPFHLFFVYISLSSYVVIIPSVYVPLNPSSCFICYDFFGSYFHFAIPSLHVMFLLSYSSLTRAPDSIVD